MHGFSGLTFRLLENAHMLNKTEVFLIYIFAAIEIMTLLEQLI